MELLKKITPEEISPTLHIGREDSPELGTEGMQQLFDAHPNINSANANYNVEIQNRNNTAVQAHMDNTKNPHSVTKAQVGLGNVDNTTDLNKPVSIAQQNTLNTKADKVNTYTKAEVDTKLATKANTIDVNTKLATKADISYTDQKDADTLVSAKAYADQKVVDIGTGDMAMAVYDPWGRKGNVFEHIEDISIHTPALTANKTIYVSPTGSDESGDGSEGKPYKTPKKLESVIPYLIFGHIVEVIFEGGTYPNCGNISINTNGTVILKPKDVSRPVILNDIVLVLKSGVLDINNMTLNAIVDNSYVVYAERLTELVVVNCIIQHESINVGYGIGIYGKGDISNTRVKSKYGFRCNEGGIIEVTNATGECLVPYYVNGGIIISSGTIPTYTTGPYVSFKGGIYIKDGVVQGQSESGTWTPRFWHTQGNVEIPMLIRTATYYIRGNMCKIIADAQYEQEETLPNSELVVTGLPRKPASIAFGTGAVIYSSTIVPVSNPNYASLTFYNTNGSFYSVKGIIKTASVRFEIEYLI